jgi:hypothetical protein
VGEGWNMNSNMLGSYSFIPSETWWYLKRTCNIYFTFLRLRWGMEYEKGEVHYSKNVLPIVNCAHHTRAIIFFNACLHSISISCSNHFHCTFSSDRKNTQNCA